MYVRNTIKFESLDGKSSLALMQCIMKENRSNSYMKVVGKRSRSQEQKKVKNPYSHNV